MTHLELLNHNFNLILSDPFNQEAWADFDLSCIYLSKNGYNFKQHKNKFNCSNKTIRFSRKQQRDFIKMEIKRALDLQFFEYLNQLLAYRKDVLSKWRNVKRKIKVYQVDYFIEKDGEIHFCLSGHPLLDMKTMRIIKRRCKLTWK